MAAQQQPSAQTDHAGLEVLGFEACLCKLASVPVGRVGFLSAGEVEILPVNHVLDGRSVVFRTAEGSKLAGASSGYPVTFEADFYSAVAKAGWSVVVHGQAEVVDDDGEISRLDALGLRPWGGQARPYWVRIRPLSVTGRQTVPSAR
jgi:nitroimidazol reductase NimA-like FMN-containing flavoprotein (pyridoxamine 5'-phosphate oxidase superfamily)